ncbi:MAG: EAL domain-containing protein [Oscillospiraceae bacterium]|nr:EAL domain-containing protein [Oscillospiraceae bacterium]
MRITFCIIFLMMILILVICTTAAWRSPKKIGKPVATLEASLIPPILGNLMIVGAPNELAAHIGYYVYFIGMDLVMFALIQFAVVYCMGAGNGQKVPKFIYGLLTADMIQILLNPFSGHVFDTEPLIMDDNSVYHRLLSYIGQIFHRVVDYCILAGVILIFIIIILRNPRVYREKYSIILITMILAGLWQSFYVFSHVPIDRSMIGFGISGIMIFYFALYYRPLRLLDRMLSDIASEMPEALFVFDPNRICIWANEQGRRLAEIHGSNYEKASENLIRMFGNSKQPSEPDRQVIERTVGSGAGTKYYILEEQEVRDEKQKFTGSYLRVRDVTEEKRKLKREMYNATHDTLTGLYTREYLYQRIAETLSANPDTEYLIIFIDVKNFKIVNDIFGNDFGDYALQCIAEWGRNTLSDDCLYGRLAGDTFGICIPKAEFDSSYIEDKISNFVVKTEKAEHHLLVQLGVYAADRKNMDVSVMFDRAHLALSTIKDEYHTHVAYYDTEIRQQLLWNQEISAQLHNAIESRQLCPYLQPIADSSGKTVGAEALARWIHPEHGFLSPALFIPVFEKNGMIVEVDKHMWRCACEILSRWETEHPDLFISVNISPKDFYFIDVVSEIKNLVNEFHIPPSKLRIEITETVMMNNADNRMEILNIFRQSGFIVEMDDFGSGYSSLNMLKDMPVDVLKIDMKFLGRTKDSGKAQKIVKNIIHLSKELGITALTEGVETEKQYQSLAEMGCSLFQGYYFSKPLPVKEFETYLKTAQAE